MRHFRVLPTDPRFLALTRIECAELYYRELLALRREVRLAKEQPATTLDDLLSDEVFEEQGASLEKQWAAEAGAEPTEPDIRFSAPPLDADARPPR